MTIKQYGGVFGRNPTFNDVTIDGELIINGDTFTGLDYQGAWNASTNTPTLASSTGTLGEFYIVSVAGATDLNGITNWGVGDWALFNGSVWQRVEGGADGNFNNLTANSLTVEAASGGEAAKFVTNDATAANNAGMLIYNIASATPATRNAQLILDPSGANASGGDYLIVSAKGDNSASIINYHATSTLALGTGGIERLQIDSTGNVTLPVGNLVIGTSGKGIDFSATAGTGTSELFDDYEEGVWTPTQGTFTTWTSPTFAATYTKVGRLVTLNIVQTGGVIAASSAGLYIGGSPYSAAEFSAGAVSDGNINDYGHCVMSGTTIFFSKIIPAEINLIVTITFHVA